MVASSDTRWSNPGRIQHQLLVQTGGANYNATLYQQLLQSFHAQTLDATTLAGLSVEVVQCPEGFIQALSQALDDSGFTVFAEPHCNGTVQTGITPNDPQFSSQWGLTKCDFQDAWAQAEGKNTIIIGHIDSGVDGTHPDLAANLVAGFNWLTDGLSTDTHDRTGHGTATAGVCNAVFNNAVGIAGAAANCKLMPLSVLDGTASYANIAAAFMYAADHNCNVITCSIGGTASSLALQQAVQYAQSKGVVTCGAGGNFSSSAASYPGAYCDLNIGATNESDQICSFSNFGSLINLYAPGIDITTTALGGGYLSGWYGTSFSCPLVAGAVALMISGQGALLRADLVSEITNASNCQAITGGLRMNANLAVAAAIAATPSTGPTPDTPAVTITSPATGQTFSTKPFTIGVKATSNVAITKITVSVDGQQVGSGTASPLNITYNPKKLGIGTHTITASATNGTHTGTATPVTFTK